MKGSAYIFVLGAILVTTILLLSALKQSTNARKKVFHTNAHLVAANLKDACITYLFHRVKSWPFDHKRDIELEDGNLSLPDGTCSWKTENLDSLRFSFLVRGQNKEIKSEVRLLIQGSESSRGIRWKYGLERP